MINGNYRSGSVYVRMPKPRRRRLPARGDAVRSRQFSRGKRSYTGIVADRRLWRVTVNWVWGESTTVPAWTLRRINQERKGR